MIQRILAAFFLTECRAFLCALTAAALFIVAGAVFCALNQPPAAPWCTCFALVAYIFTYTHEKPNRTR